MKKIILIPIFVSIHFVAISQENKPSTPILFPVSSPVLPPAYTNPLVNFVRTWEPNIPLSNEGEITSRIKPVKEVKEMTVYVDGLGRTMQTINKGVAPSGGDLVLPTVYDNLGREALKYLPYATSYLGDGNLKLNPIAEQQQFYQGYSAALQNTVYFAETEYEPSPLNRVSKNYGVGNAWARQGGNHPAQKKYLFNTVEDQVINWIVDTNGAIAAAGYYAAGTLYKEVDINEDGFQVVKFKDKSGQEILRKDESLSNHNGGAYDGWLFTYYVYDNAAQLVSVIPPLAIAKMNGIWSLTSEIKDGLCFQYTYDVRGRLVEKKLPGAGVVEMVYDTRDRQVFSRDGNMKNNGEWIVVFYDGLNRPVEHAIYHPSIVTDRQTLQTAMSGGANANGQQVFIFPGLENLELATDDNRIVYEAKNSIVFLPGYESPNAEREFRINPELTSGQVNISVTNQLATISATELTPISFTYYDNYDFPKASSYVGFNFTPYKTTADIGAVDPVRSLHTHGLNTGSSVRVLGTNTWLTTSRYFDDQGRVIEVIKDNNDGGKTIENTMYSFAGKTLKINERNNNIRATAPYSQLTTLTLMTYDEAGRLLTTQKQYNDNVNTRRIISSNTYDLLGNLSRKELGINSEGIALTTLDYDYNIRGWLTAVNKNYVTTGSGDRRYFGEILSYENGFNERYFGGNIAGKQWRGFNDPLARAYGYSYDNANRLLRAYFSQQNSLPSDPWTQDVSNYSVSNISYDANGNIAGMKQEGTAAGQYTVVDNLLYRYKASSNQLESVMDNGGTAGTLGDFKNSPNDDTDYNYDPNGNLTRDNNKGLSNVSYNFLNLPETITFGNKGSIDFLYDADGKKLRKTVSDKTVIPNKVKVTDYVNDLVYVDDKLEFIGHEEGRMRMVNKEGEPLLYIYDYFLKDHLGNTRSVLTEHNDANLYTASMESLTAATEGALFSNLEATRTPVPVGYPEDATTATNMFVSKLNGATANKVGASLVLRVMAGDSIKIGNKAFYKSTEGSRKDASKEEILSALLNAFGEGKPGGGHGGGAVRQRAASNLTSNDLRKLVKDESAQQLNRPKAYLNFVLFDDQFKLVEQNSGVKQVAPTPDVLQTLNTSDMVMSKSGFLYIYTSNETNQDVFFDNLTVAHNAGPVLEETHYYPFGLTIAGLSSNALKGTSYPENRIKYIGKELQTRELKDGTGLDCYDFGTRLYDPQIARWHTLDPLIEKMRRWSPYNYAFDNPIRFIDVDGMAPFTDYYNMSGTKIKHIEDGKKDQVMVLTRSEKGKDLDNAINKGALLKNPTAELVDKMSDAYNKTESTGKEHLFMVGQNGKTSIVVQGQEGTVTGSQSLPARENLEKVQMDKYSYDVHTHTPPVPEDGGYSYGKTTPSKTDIQGTKVGPGYGLNIVLGYQLKYNSPGALSTGSSSSLGPAAVGTYEPERAVGFYDNKGKVRDMTFKELIEAINKMLQDRKEEVDEKAENNNK